MPCPTTSTGPVSFSVPKYQREALARFDANGDTVFIQKPYQAQSIHAILDKMAAPAD